MNSQDDVVSLDPVRLRLIEAMERRAAAHGGETRRLIDERIAALRAEPGHGVRLDAASGAGIAVRPDALAELVAQMADRASVQAGLLSPDVHAGSGIPVAATEIESLAYFRNTWSRLSAERRLKRSLATVPRNAGPLNSHHLVHRALQTMRETSPGYLHHFMTYVDALLWVDQTGDGSLAARVPASRAKTAKGLKESGRARAT